MAPLASPPDCVTSGLKCEGVKRQTFVSVCGVGQTRVRKVYITNVVRTKHDPKVAPRETPGRLVFTRSRLLLTGYQAANGTGLFFRVSATLPALYQYLIK